MSSCNVGLTGAWDKVWLAPAISHTGVGQRDTSAGLLGDAH